jgi:pyruvate,water dikinase
MTWEAPGPGVWELEQTHFQRPATAYLAEIFPIGFVRGFRHGTARYGLLLDHLQPAYVNGFAYMQPVPFGAPPGAAGPPPKPVLWLLVRLHPKMRARLAEGQRARDEKRWRADLAEWDDVDRAALIAGHRALQEVDITTLSDEELIVHLERVRENLGNSYWMHHKYTIPAILMVGDFLAGATDWTGIPASDLLGVLRGSSNISRGFAAEELDGATAAIGESPAAQTLLGSAGDASQLLADLAADATAGAAIGAYLDAVRYRGLGYDVSDAFAGEMPDMLLDTLRAAAKGVAPTPIDTAAEDAIRAKVPQQHRADFDERLAEARLVYRLRDERGVYADGWATGLARRALLEAGRRLAAAGRLQASEHAVDLRHAEVVGLLRGADSPSLAEVVDRTTHRTTHTVDDAPPFLGGEPSGPPDPALLPPHARRWARANDMSLALLFGFSEAPNTNEVLLGTPVNAGVYEGTARVVHGAEDFGRVQQGDVLVTRNTSPYFNVVLPLLGALVTDRGGLLSHAAIVAREYGIPGIVGTREATAKILDGARVRVDGGTGEVTILA